MTNWELTRAPGAPAIAPVLSLEEARLHLRVDAAGGVHPDDTLIQSYVQAATDELDGGDGWLGRALCTQQWRLTLDAFPAGAIKLPLPPLQTLDGISYVNVDGSAQLLSPSAYRVLDWSDPARVEPVYGASWPTTRGQAGAVSITFTCGFGSPDEVPELIRNYIRLRLGQYYENRELVAMGVTIAEIPFLRDSLENFRRSVRPV
jgi:uncharacterized phiE125 gp8 family phage protein